MIDYLLIFPDPAARAAAYPVPEDGSPQCWLLDDVTAVPVIITTVAATLDDAGNQITPAEHPAGSWLRLRSGARLPEIEALANCMLATDSEAAAAGRPYIVFHRFQPDAVLGQISPMFAGDEYLIPVGQPASVLQSLIIHPAA